MLRSRVARVHAQQQQLALSLTFQNVLKSWNMAVILLKINKTGIPAMVNHEIVQKLFLHQNYVKS